MATGQFAERFAERVLAARRLVILATLVLVAAASSGIAFLEFSANYRIFFDEDNPQLLALEALENTYGKNENVVFLIVPDDGDATSQSALSAAVWLTDAAWHTPFSRRVDSLANFQHTTADGDDLYVRDLVDPQELARDETRSRIRSIASSDPRIAGSILARNGDVSVVNVTIELPEEGLLEAVAEVAEFARSVAAQAEERFPDVDLRIVGTVMINQTFVEASIDSQMIFLPASLLLMALILGVVTRGWPGVAATGTVIIFSILASVGLGAWAGMPFSPPISPAADHRPDDCRGELRAPAGNRAAASACRGYQARGHRRVRQAQSASSVPGEPHHGARIPEHELLRSAALPSSRQLRRLRHRRLLHSLRHIPAGTAFPSPDSSPEGPPAPPWAHDEYRGGSRAALPAAAALGMAGRGAGDGPGHSAQRAQRRPGSLLRRKGRVPAGHGLHGRTLERQHPARILP